MTPLHSGLRPGVLTAALALACLSAATAMAAPRAWRINPAHTSIGFVVDGVGWPRTHGRFTRFKGRIAIDFERPQASRVAFDVDAASVDVGSASFNDYLRTDAFFDVANYPTISFTSTEVEKLDDRHARVSGRLTLRGVTRPLALTVELAQPASNASTTLDMRATTTIKRLAFNMKAGFPAISNDVAVVIDTQAQAP